MRVLLVLSIIVSMLSGCSPTGEPQPAAATSTPVDPSDRSQSAAGAPTATSSQRTSDINMPQAFRGQWRENDLGRNPTREDCNQTSQSNRNFGKVLAINAGGYSAFEDGGRIVEVHSKADNMIDATFDTTYADTRTSARKDFTMQPNGSLAVQNDQDNGRFKVIEYLRCP